MTMKGVVCSIPITKLATMKCQQQKYGQVAIIYYKG